MDTSTNASTQNTANGRRRRTRLFRRSALAIAVAMTVAGGVAAIAKTTPILPDNSPLVIDQPVAPAPPSFAALVERVKPAVVNVSVTGRSASSLTGDLQGLELPSDPHFKEFFERFFRQSPTLPDQRAPSFEVKGVGSGFIVTADGYIVTSHHVVENATEIHVVLNDGQRLPAEVRGEDPKTDLALLKVNAEGQLPYIVFGDSDKAKPGDWVLAIGNPFGLGGTATTGIVSARGRDIQSGPYDDYLQIDAPINRGNSGGPLFDLTGRVIGVNTAIFSPNGGNVGIGFAVPAEQAKSVIQQLMSKGQVERGWLGVQIQRLTDELAKSLRLPNAQGALVSGVSPDSPAAQAGIQVGDVITAFDDHAVVDMKDLPKLVAEKAPGQKTKITVWRQGAQRDLQVAIARSTPVTAEARQITSEPVDGARLGLALAPITEALRQRYDLAADVDGALVVETESGGAAAREGIRPGDVIVQAGGRAVSKPADVLGVVRQAHAAAEDRLLLLVNRQGDQRFVSVQLG